MKDKASENIRLLKSFYAAVASGDLISARGTLDPDVEWVEPYVPNLWFSGIHRSPESVLKQVLEPITEKIRNYRIKIKKFFAFGDHVIAIGTLRGRGKFNHRELDAPTAHVWTLRSGKVVRFEAFHDPASWQDALGLPQLESERMAA